MTATVTAWTPAGIQVTSDAALRSLVGAYWWHVSLFDETGRQYAGEGSTRAVALRRARAKRREGRPW